MVTSECKDKKRHATPFSQRNVFHDKVTTQNWSVYRTIANRGATSHVTCRLTSVLYVIRKIVLQCLVLIFLLSYTFNFQKV